MKNLAKALTTAMILMISMSTCFAADVWIKTEGNHEYYVDDKSLAYNATQRSYEIDFVIKDLNGYEYTVRDRMAFYRYGEIMYYRISNPRVHNYVDYDSYTGAIYKYVIDHKNPINGKNI